MSVKTYSLKSDGEKNVSKNFKVREFRCHDGSDQILISPETVNILQSIRDYFGKSVTINSAYRTSSYNKKVGGATSSQHVKGTACDIVVSGVPPEAVAAYIEAFYPITGCGLYSTFVHVDTRGYKVRWKNTGSNVVSSFNLGNRYLKYKATEEQKVEEEKVTQEQFNKMMEVYLSEVAKEEPGNWSIEERTWAENVGLIEGDENGNKRYKSNITREETAVILKRFLTYLQSVNK